MCALRTAWKSCYRCLTSVPPLFHCLMMQAMWVAMLQLYQPHWRAIRSLWYHGTSAAGATDLSADCISLYPPGALHFGGTWERGVWSVKLALKVALREQSLPEPILHTVLVETEGILNAKRLWYVSSDIKDILLMGAHAKSGLLSSSLTLKSWPMVRLYSQWTHNFHGHYGLWGLSQIHYLGHTDKFGLSLWRFKSRSMHDQ